MHVSNSFQKRSYSPSEYTNLLKITPMQIAATLSPHTKHEVADFGRLSKRFGFEFLISDKNRPLKSAKVAYDFLTERIAVKKAYN
jgi:hypothetical protein